MYNFNPRLSFREVRLDLSASEALVSQAKPMRKWVWLARLVRQVLFAELSSVFLETVHGAILVLQSLKGHHSCQTVTTPAARTSPERGENTCLLYCGPCDV